VGVPVSTSQRDAFRVFSPSNGLPGSYFLQSILGENSGKSMAMFKQTIHVFLCKCHENVCRKIYSEV